MTQLQQETAIPTPPNSIITTQMIVPPSTPTKVIKTKLEVVAGVFVIFFVGTLITIAIVDRAAAAVRQAARGRGPGHHPGRARRDQRRYGAG